MSNTRRVRRKRISPNVRDLPPAVDKLITYIMAHDAAYFTEHPDIRAMNRKYIPGEAWPYAAPLGSRVQVIVVSPGVRLRTFADGAQVLDVDEQPKGKAA
jgi:hypothetical protein